MFRRRWMLVVVLTHFLAAIAFSNRGAAEALHGVLVREEDNPWGMGATIGWGLATDGNYLYASSHDDGMIRVIDIPTLAIVDTIDTDAEAIWGLAFRGGSLYGVAPQAAADSRFFTVDLANRDFDWKFNAPSDGFTTLSFGPDGLLYAADGFEGQGVAGTRIYAFDAVTGTILRTIRPRLIGDPPDEGDEIIGTNVLEWLPGGQLLIDFPIGADNLNLPTVVDDVLIPGPVFDVPEFLRPEPRYGSAVHENTLYLFSYRTSGVAKFYEIQIVPEPAGGVLVGAGAIAAFAFALLRTRPSQQHAVVRGIRSA